MKKTILLVLLAFLGSILFADPFGLKMGMTLAEIAEKCSGGKEPEYVGGGVMYKIDPIKKNEHFNEYRVLVHDDLGLFGIIADTVPEDEVTCKKRAHLLSLLLGRAYGNEELCEEFNSYFWLADRHPSLKKERLSSVLLEIDNKGEKKFSSLMYSFENLDEAKESSGSPF